MSSLKGKNIYIHLISLWIPIQNINPLLPIAHKSAQIGKISFLKLEGIIKKIPMSDATMSR